MNVDGNSALLEDLYDRWLADPNSVDASWQKYFRSIEIPTQVSVPPTAPSQVKPGVKEHSVLYYPHLDLSTERDLRLYNLINAYRTYGHLMARFNPLATHEPVEPEQLKLETFGFSRQDLSSLFPTFGLLRQEKAPLLDILNTLKAIYCNKIGFEYMGLQNPELETWLQAQIEPGAVDFVPTMEQKQMILNQLNKSELFESFIHTKYVGQKRFSLEGSETLIPILATVIDKGTEMEMEEFVVGMAHRGRLNVLTNILDKSYTEMFSEFEDGYIPNTFEGSGDVKYHKGYLSTVRSVHGHQFRITLSPNPSHLESVDAVVEGQARARQVVLQDENQEKVVPILIHGDAALSGQGVVYEVMQFYRLNGYSTGGTLHIVINNQIGFTTLPEEGRSTQYCTDIARTFGAPVFHVDAEDPDSCIYVANLAVQIRQQFHCDVFIDLNCYRKYGHNETDEPAFTQPIEYQMIRSKKPIREIYRDALIHHGVVEKFMAESLEAEFKTALHHAMEAAKAPTKRPEIEEAEKVDEQVIFKNVMTGVPLQTLREIGTALCRMPPDFKVHPKLENLLKDRREMVGEGTERKPIDWGMAELLAYGSLLWGGISVRLSGQDSRRGTFSHRHAAFVDQSQNARYFPLQHLKPEQGRFDVYNSPLSEFGVLGFEFGYSIGDPETLVLWEAQFGDFGNGAQVIIDQYIATAEQKWGQKFSLTLLLPHGYEGQGPEHSSARIERFLTLCGNDNMFVVNPTTPAQFFHLLRRQGTRSLKKPLIVFTPKGLLRHPACVSNLEDLAEGSFKEILDDTSPLKAVKKVVLCSGRIYYDLIQERAKENSQDMAIIRIEQLYPLNIDVLKEVLGKYADAEEYFWVQDEPCNMGAWDYMQPLLQKLMPQGKTIGYIGRARSASPAVGSHAIHKKQHAEIMHALFKKRDPSIFEIAGNYKA